jgi:MFS family permease
MLSAGVTLARDYAAHVRSFSPSARFFLLAATLGGVSGGVTNLLLNLYIVSLGYPEEILPRFTRVGLAGAALAAVVGGPLTDWLRPRRAMLLGTALAACGAVAILIAPSAIGLMAGLGATSAGSVLVYIAAPAFLVRQSSRAERPYLFGVTAACYVVSTAAGAALGGYLPALFRVTLAAPSEASVYRAALLAGSLLSACGIPLLWLTSEGHSDSAAVAAVEGAAGERAASSSPPDGPLVDALVQGRLWKDMLRRFSDPAFVKLVAKFILADGLIRVGGNLILPYLNVYFVRHLGASEALYGTLRFGERGLVVMTTLLVALFVTRFGPVATVVVTQLLSVPFLLVLGFAPTVGIAAGAFLIRGPLMEMTQPTRDNFLMDVAPEKTRATAFAALTLAGYAIGFGASFPAERLLSAGSFETAFAATAVLYVVSAALYWLFFRRAAAQTAATVKQPIIASRTQ